MLRLVIIRPPNQKPVKYRTIRVREEVAKQLDEWRDLFEDASISEALWRIFSLARRELRRVKDKKRKARERIVKARENRPQLADIVDKDMVE